MSSNAEAIDCSGWFSVESLLFAEGADVLPALTLLSVALLLCEAEKEKKVISQKVKLV